MPGFLIVLPLHAVGLRLLCSRNSFHRNLWISVMLFSLTRWVSGLVGCQHS